MKAECWYCGIDLDCEIKTYAPNQHTRDHVIPICRGGSNQLSNLVDCCRTCNSSKRAKTLEEFRAYWINKYPLGHMHLVLLKLEADLTIPQEDRDQIEKLRETLSPCPVVTFHGEASR